MVGWVGELSERVSVLATASGVPLLAGHFRCEPGDPAWRGVNRVGDVAHLVFPRTAVSITPLGDHPIATDANRIVLYRAGEEYRRARLDPRGDDCVFIALGDELLDELAGRSPIVDRRRRGFAVRERTCPPSTYVALQLLRAAATDEGDTLATDELLLQLTGEVLGDEARRPSRREPLAEAVRLVLAGRYTEPLTLAEIAADVGASPYHLHRRFRAATGWTIHTYRDSLRLREGLARVVDGADDLAALACDLGYSSHSHFTARFRRAFGMTPSAARERGGGRRPGGAT